MRGIPLWKFAASVPFPASNIQRIEAGITEPRIGLAMKMLLALNVEIGAFMQTLAEAQNWRKYEFPDGFSGEKLRLISSEMAAEGYPPAAKDKAIFGKLYRRVRATTGLSQAVIGARAGYSTRSLIDVENGRQEPMVMRALQLVWVMGVDVKSVFESYVAILRPKD